MAGAATFAGHPRGHRVRDRLTHCGTGVDNLRALLAALGATGPEVGCGRETPIAAGASFPDAWRTGADTLGGVPLPPAPDAGQPTRPAADIIAELLDASSVPVTILTLGPLTNLADALGDDADRIARVSQVVAMGGALDVPGNVVPDGASSPTGAEWNLHADAGAAQAIVRSAMPLTFVGLDATRDVPLTPEIAGSLAGDHPAAGASIVNELLVRNPFLLDGTFSLWDPLAAAAMVDPDLITRHGELLSVTTTGDDAGRLVRDRDGLPAQVATAADAARFGVAFLAGLRQGDPHATAAPPVGRISITWDGTTCALSADGVSGPGATQLETVDSAVGPVFGALVGLSDGHTVDDLRTLVSTFEPASTPPPWLVIAASIDAQGGATGQVTVELPVGTFAGLCVTDPSVTTGFVVADGEVVIAP